MRIGFIGAGKVGFTLGKYLEQKLNKEEIQKNLPETVTVSGYYSRQVESAKEAAAFTNTEAFDDLKKIVCASDVLMLTVPDGRIEAVWDSIKAFGYSIHPMYAISSTTKSYREMQKCFFTVEGAEEWGNKLCRFIRLLGNDCVLLSTENKTKYHAAAVFASNLVNGLYGSAVSLLEDCGFEEKQAEQALVPLFMGNASHIAEDGPVAGLTGPIERNDTTTVKKHLNVLDANEKHIYISVSGAVLALAEQKYPNRDYSEMKKILSGQE